MGSRSYRCKIYAVYALVILGASFVIAGIIVVARDSFKSLVKDKIKEVGYDKVVHRVTLTNSLIYCR